MADMRALVTGATGFVGRHLLRRLDRPVVLSRSRATAERALAEFNVRVHAWEPQQDLAPRDAFEGIEVVFHLAGEPISTGRWTAAKKTRLRESRLGGTRNLVQTLLGLESPPRVLISASAVGYYGDRGDEVLTETAGPGQGFLSSLCVDWEAASQRATTGGLRVVNPRMGIVLGPDGGALTPLLTPFKLGLGSPLGTGRQWLPWIHIDDMIGLLLYIATHETITGAVNAVAPQPIRNREFTKALGKVLGRPTVLPAVPAFALRLGMGDFADVVLASQRAIPAAAQTAGYDFQFPNLDAALRQIIP